MKSEFERLELEYKALFLKLDTLVTLQQESQTEARKRAIDDIICQIIEVNSERLALINKLANQIDFALSLK